MTEMASQTIKTEGGGDDDEDYVTDRSGVIGLLIYIWLLSLRAQCSPPRPATKLVTH